MKKTIVRVIALALALILVGSLCVTAFAAESNSFNAGLQMTYGDDGSITVTVSSDAETNAVLASQKPTLSVVCDYADVTVTAPGGNELPFVVAGGKVSFTVEASGSYTITPAFVAEADNTKFFSLADAFASGAATVKLLKNLTVAEGTSLTIPSGVTLDMNGFDLTVDGKLTILGSLDKNGGTIVGPQNIFCTDHPDSDADGKCDICGFFAGGALAGNTLTLNGDIVQNYYTYLDDPEGVTMSFTLNGKTTTVSPVAAGDGMYNFPFRVAAKEMTANVTATLMQGQNEGQTYTFNSREYADVILNSTNDTYVAAQPMVRAMLHYGAYAQLHFGYNTGSLANAGLGSSGIEDVTYTTLSDFARPATQNTSGIRFLGASMLLESNTTLRLFFRVTCENPVFTYNGQTLTTGIRNGNTYVDIPNICASDLDQIFTVTFSDGTSQGSVAYSPMHYCYTILRSSGYAQSLKDLVRSIWLYNQAANDYFG